MTKIKELFVILEDRPNALGELLHLFAGARIEIETLGVFGDSAKLIVSHLDKAQKIMEQNNYSFETRDILRATVESKTKEMAYIMERIGRLGINIYHVYGTTRPGDKRIALLLDVSDVDAALSLFQ
ncbi:MAG: hypothetical protein ACOY90_14990 [Candidatus Zhuqueibacterota bacterium]